MYKKILFIQLITISWLPLYGDEWKLSYSRESDGLTVWTKDLPGSDLLGFRCTKKLSHSIEVLSEALLSSDPDIKKEFVMGLTSFEIWQRTKDSSRQRFKAYTAFDLPFPFEDRDLVVQSIVSVDKKNKTVTIEAYSIEDNRYPKVNSIGVRFHMEKSTIVLKMVNAEETLVTMEMIGSLKGSVPPWLMNFINNHWAKTTIDQLDEVVLEFKPAPNQFVKSALENKS